jgi:hypothetical protein
MKGSGAVGKRERRRDVRLYFPLPMLEEIEQPVERDAEPSLPLPRPESIGQDRIKAHQSLRHETRLTSDQMLKLLRNPHHHYHSGHTGSHLALGTWALDETEEQAPLRATTNFFDRPNPKRPLYDEPNPKSRGKILKVEMKPAMQAIFDDNLSDLEEEDESERLVIDDVVSNNFSIKVRRKKTRLFSMTSRFLSASIIGSKFITVEMKSKYCCGSLKTTKKLHCFSQGGRNSEFPNRFLTGLRTAPLTPWRCVSTSCGQTSMPHLCQTT